MAKCIVCGKRKGFGNAEVRCRGCWNFICNRQSCVKLKQHFSLWSKRCKHCQAENFEINSNFSPLIIYYDQYLCPTCYLSRERKIQITLSMEKRKIRELKMAKNYEIALNYEKAAEIYEKNGMWEDAGRCRRLQLGKPGEEVTEY